jgi:hypothetical protein
MCSRRCPAPPAELLLQDLRLAGPVQIDQRLCQLEFNGVPEALPRATAVHARAAHEAQRSRVNDSVQTFQWAAPFWRDTSAVLATGVH